ncbi:MAG: hypothetical protein Q7R33_02780 [Nitrosarchaeum sp.]|nr:hypothetical protein [Nitrosarchaeum sp.]
MDMEQKVKSFWSRPEGKVGLGVIAIAGLVFFSKILPWLIVLMQNTLTFGILLAVIAILVYVVIDPKNRALAAYMYKSVMRKITGCFITIDPIGILKNYIDDIETNLEKMGKQIGNLKGVMRTLKNKIDANAATIKDNMERASMAQKKGIKSEEILSTRKAGRLQQSNITLNDLYKKMEVIYRVLAKMYENCRVLIEDTKDQVSVKESEWKAIQEGSKAMRSAMSVINGDPDKRAIYEQTLEYMADDLGNKMGEMERFMELSESFMNGIDLENGVFEEKGMKMLEEWEKGSESLLLGDEKAAIVNSIMDKVDYKPETVAAKSDEFSNLFSK